MKDLLQYDNFKKMTDRGKLITAYLYETHGFNRPIPISIVDNCITEFEILGFQVTQQDLNIFLTDMFFINWHDLGNDFFHLELNIRDGNNGNKSRYYSDYLQIMKSSWNYRLEQIMLGLPESELKLILKAAHEYKRIGDKIINPITFILGKKYKNYLQ